MWVWLGIRPSQSGRAHDAAPATRVHPTPCDGGAQLALNAEVQIVGAMRARVQNSASVSLYAGLVARALGARNVTFVEARADVRAQASTLGLDAISPAQPRKLPTAGWWWT